MAWLCSGSYRSGLCGDNRPRLSAGRSPAVLAGHHDFKAGAKGFTNGFIHNHG
jgi:hypothetical protein